MLHGFGLLRQQYTKYATGSSLSPDGTVQVLAEKLGDSTQSRDDRRAAVLSLKALTRDHAAAVAQHALLPLVRLIKTQENDQEMLRAAVEACLAVCQAPAADTTPLAEANKRAVATMHRLLQEPDAVGAFLALLQPAHAFYTRFASLQLLATLLEHQRPLVQEKVLAVPGGCSAVLQCLEAAPSSSTEIIRNETLLLLSSLVTGNPDIQQVVAFDGAFERLLDIIAQEGRIEGGVLVQDALACVEVLLLDNSSNQKYFRETRSISLLAPLLFFPAPLPPSADAAARHEYQAQSEAFLLQEWDDEKLANAFVLLRCIRHLVDGHGEYYRDNQQAMREGGVTECLIQLAFASLASPLLKAHTLHLLAAILRTSRPNQDLLSSSVVTPVALLRHDPEPGVGGEPRYEVAWQAPQPAMLCLIALALRGPGGIGAASAAMAVRTAAMAAFDALVANNVDVRMTLLHAMVAAPAPDQNHGNASQLLLDSVANLPLASGSKADASQSLLASLMLGSLLHGSETAKEFARRIHQDADGRCVATPTLPLSTEDDPPTTLLQLVVGNMTMASRELEEAVRRERAASTETAPTSQDWTRVMVGYLVLLSHWFWQSPDSVADWVRESANLEVLLKPAAQPAGADVLLQGLATFVLGLVYEYNPLASHADGVWTREAMHPVLMQKIGADAFAARIVRVKQDARFAQVGPDTLEQFVSYATHPQGAAPVLWFSWLFAEFWKEHYAHVQKALLTEPSATAASSGDASAELLDARQQVTALTTELHRVQAEAALVGKRAETAHIREDAHDTDRLREQLHEARRVLAETKKALNEAQSRGQGQTDASESHHAELARVREEAEAVEKQLRTEHRAELRRLQEMLQTEAVEPRAAPSDHAAIEAVRKEGEAQIERVRQEHAAEMDRLRTKGEADVERLEGQIDRLQSDLRSVRSELEVEVEQLQIKHRSEMDRVRTEHAAEIERIRAESEAALEQARAASLAGSATSPSEAARVAELQQENEDLLVLLDELSTKHKRNKDRMRVQGWEVSDDEDDDDVEL